MSFFLAALISTALLSPALASDLGAVDLGVRDLDGRAVTVDGPRVVVFWSMDCAACVDLLAERSRAGEDVVAVNVDAASERSLLRPFLAGRGLGGDLVVVADPAGEIAGRLGAREGEVVVVDAAGGGAGVAVRREGWEGRVAAR